MTKRKILIEQLFLFPLCMLVSYIFVSLRKYNEVHYSGANEIFTSILSPMLLNSILIYAIITVILRTKLHALISKTLKVFDIPQEMKPSSYYVNTTIIFFAFYSLMLKQPMDYPTHTYWAIDIFDWRSLRFSIISIPYPLWHIAVSLMNRVCYVPALYAAALVSGCFYSWEYTIIYKIVLSLNRNEFAKLEYSGRIPQQIAFFSMALMFVQPIFVPWFSNWRFLGQGTPNIWDNPTQVAVYPFALIVTYLFIQLFYSWGGTNHIDFLRLGFYSLFGVIAKPSFFQIFIPAVAIVLLIRLIKSRGKSFAFSVKIVLSFVPAGVWCLLIFILTFISQDTLAASDGNGIGIGFLEAWSLYSPNIPFSIFLGATFPIVYLILANNTIKEKKMISFIVLCYVIGILEFMFLKETGYRLSHANFGWGYRIGITLLFVFVGSNYILSIIKERLYPKKIALIIPTVILTLNALFGIEYYVELWRRNILF